MATPSTRSLKHWKRGRPPHPEKTDLRQLAGRALRRKWWREKPSLWVADKINIQLARYRSRQELEAWLEQQPADAHAWCRERMAQGKLKLDPDRSYQAEALDRMATPGQYALQWCNGASKTTTAALFVHWFLDCFPGGKVLTSAGTWSQLKEQLWREIHLWAGMARAPIAANCAPRGLGKMGIDLAPDWAVMARAADKGSTFEGVHGQYVLVLLDEGKAIKPEIFESVRRILRGNPGAHFWFVCLSSPGSPTGPFWDITNGDQAHRWTTLRLSAYESERVSLEQLAIDREDLGESSPLFIAMNVGEFPAEGEDTVIPLSWVQAAVGRQVNEADGNFLGCDVARFGGDETALVSLFGRRAEISAVYQGKDTVWTASKVRELHGLNAYQGIGIDDTGVGGGVTDQLQADGLPAYGINFGSTEDLRDPEHHVNIKAEMYFMLRAEFEAGFRDWQNPMVGLGLPNDKKLLHQLAMQRYKFDSRGRYRIESHEELKKRGERSPDRADGLVLANLLRVGELTRMAGSSEVRL